MTSLFSLCYLYFRPGCGRWVYSPFLPLFRRDHNPQNDVRQQARHTTRQQKDKEQ